MCVKSVSSTQINISFNPNHNPINCPSCCSEFYLLLWASVLTITRMGILPGSCKHRGSGERTECSWRGGSAGSTSGLTHLPSLSAGSFQGNSLPDTTITNKSLHMLCSPHSLFISVWPWACPCAVCCLNQEDMYPSPLGCWPQEHPGIKISPQTIHVSCPPRGSTGLSS